MSPSLISGMHVRCIQWYIRIVNIPSTISISTLHDNVPPPSSTLLQIDSKGAAIVETMRTFDYASPSASVAPLVDNNAMHVFPIRVDFVVLDDFCLFY